MLNKFKNKKIIITGHTGFKGSWLALWLKLLGAKIIGISLDAPTKPSHFTLLNLRKKIIDIKLDIRNLKKLEKIFKKYQPDFVFHLAAQSLVTRSYKDPIKTFTTNTVGTMNVLESLKKINKRFAAIIVTSDKSYKNLEIKRGYHEKDLLGGFDPYSSSKASAELIIQTYLKSFFKIKKNIIIGIARAGNVIGGGDWAKDRLVPDIYRSLHSKKVLKIRYPNATRPWQHVLDVINGYLLLAQSNYFGAWNFGPNLKKTFKVKDILLNIKRRNPKLRWKILKPKEVQESINLNLDIKKAKNILKWQPKWKIKKALEETNKWYENFYNKKDINYLTIKQIKDFFKL